MEDLLNFFHDNNFFEENANYVMCVGDECMVAVGKDESSISYKHYDVLSDDAIRTETISFSVESLKVLKCGHTNVPVSPWCSAWCVVHTMDESKGWSYDGEGKVIFYVTSSTSGKEPITYNVMCNKKDELAYGKRMRTYLKRLVTVSSIILLAGYIATSIFNISSISLYLAVAGIIISAISLALNVWSLIDHFQKHDANKKIGIENRLLSKPACERQVLRAHRAENRSVLNIHEDLSTEATTQFPTEVEFRKKANTSEQKKKLTRICLDIASSVSFLVGGAIPLMLSTASYNVSIISFVSTSFFIVGCAVMVVNIVLWCTDSKSQEEQNNNVQVEQHSFSKIGQRA